MADGRHAFLSVTDTTGLADFARGLVARGLSLVATQRTRAHLAESGIEAEAVEQIADFPIVLGGAVMTMHPRLLAGILADREDAQALEECGALGIPLFEVVAINFTGQEANADRVLRDAHLQAGPLALIRAAASNSRHVLVATDPSDYPEMLRALESPAPDAAPLRSRLARKAWDLAAHFDSEMARRFEAGEEGDLPSVLRGEGRCIQKLRYGENPHQQAALYAFSHRQGPTVAGARILRGAALSYNNIVDADVGLNLVLEFAAPGTAIVKHAMPVSAAIGSTIADSVEKSFAAEWASRIGAAVACNGVIDAATAEAMAQPGRRIDLVIAADFSAEALRIFGQASASCGEMRLLKAGEMSRTPGTGRRRRVALHHVSGGVLAQTVDDGVYGSGGFHVATKRQPTDREMIDLEFACLVAKHARSHATVIARDGATSAVATVQTNRIEAAHIALARAGARSQQAVMASDSTLSLAEFAMLADAGVVAFIQTGDTDEQNARLVAACDERGAAMIVTCMRHYRHV